MSLAERIAQTAVNHYHEVLPGRGKPDETEWTVYAAIVASCRNEDKLWVVSAATGTKASPPAVPGSCLHDGHAEVLARRGLVSLLLSQQQEVASDERTALLQVDAEGKRRLRPNLSLHMYISDAPCGDASIYPLRPSNQEDDDENQQLAFTGAKVIVVTTSPPSATDGATRTTTATTTIDSSSSSCCWQQTHSNGSTTSLQREPGAQTLGQLRTKSGRTNVANRSLSMSCSDKLVRWAVLGLQGSLCDCSPIRLTSIVTSRDPGCASTAAQQLALERAVVTRVEAIQTLLKASTSTDLQSFGRNLVPPTVHVVDAVHFDRGKARQQMSGGKRKRDDKKNKAPSPTGLSLSWQLYSQEALRCECLVGARGILHGKRPKTDADYARLESRLCRKQRVQQYMQQCDNPTAALAATYQAYKAEHRDTVLHAVKTFILQEGPLKGWLVSSDDYDFAL